MNVLLCYCLAQNLHWKLGQLTPSFGSILFFRELNLFFVFQDRKLKLSAYVWSWISWNLPKFQLVQLIKKIVIFILSIGCLIEMKFCGVLFQTDFENFSFLSWKTKKFYSWKNRNRLNEFQQMAFEVPIFSRGFCP